MDEKLPDVNVLLVEDDHTLLDLLSQTVLEVQHDRKDCVIHYTTASSDQEAILRIGDTIPDLIVTDLYVGVGQKEALDFLERLRDNLMTRNVRVIVISGRLHRQNDGKVYGFGSADRDLVNHLTRALKVDDVFSKPFSLYGPQGLMPAIDGQINRIIDDQSGSTGLPGRSAADSDLKFVLEHSDVPSVVIRGDLRKVGLAANDLYGTHFGNEIIDLLGGIIRQMLKKADVEGIERVAYQQGGDEFQILLRSKQVRLRDLSQVARVFCLSVGIEFDQRVRMLYEGRENYHDGVLVGPGVRNKERMHVALPVPCVRFTIIPVYKGVIKETAHIPIVENVLQAQMKAMDNEREKAANARFHLPARDFPELPTEEFARLVSLARQDLMPGWSRFAIARLSTVRLVLEEHGAEMKGKGR